MIQSQGEVYRRMANLHTAQHTEMPPSLISPRSQTAEHRAVTLVVQPRGGTLTSAGAIVLTLGGPEPRIVHSFSAACSLLLSEPVSVVILVDDPTAPLDAEELDVLGKLAAAAAASVVLVRPAQPGTGGGRGAQTPARPRHSQPRSHPVKPAVAAALKVGALVSDPSSGAFLAHGRLLKLSASEARILWDVIQSPGHHLATDDLIEGRNPTQTRRSATSLRQLFYRIRRKLAAAGDAAQIVAARNGYCLVTSTMPSASQDPPR